MKNGSKAQCSVLIIFTLILGAFASGDTPPGVPPQYAHLFYLYKPPSQLSITDFVLKSIGLERTDVGRSIALVAGVSDYSFDDVNESHFAPAANAG